MELTILGSSSKGNCYVLQNDVESLVLECGVSLHEVKKAFDFNIRKIVGALITHEHGDHAAYMNDFLDARINVYASHGTLSKKRCASRFLPSIVEAEHKIQIGNFIVLPFDVRHDAAEPLGFLINHPETGNILFVTDTCYLPNRFSNLANVLIECNYSESVIHGLDMPKPYKDHILQGHLSLETCLDALSANDLRSVNNIVLIHLSDKHSNADQYKEEVYRTTGKTVHIAEKGLKIKFNRTPF